MSEEQDTQKQKVVIMDDDEFLINMYATKFEKEGYEVETKTSTEGVLEMLRGGAEPTILIVDIIMPDMDGLEMLQVMRDEGLAPNTTVIMLTNQGGSEQIDKAKELGAAGYIVKATSIPSEVVEKVEEIANRASE